MLTLQAQTTNKKTNWHRLKPCNRVPFRSDPTLTLRPTGAQRSPALREGRRSDRVVRARSENNAGAESSNPASPPLSSSSPPLLPLPELAQHRPDCRARAAWFTQTCAPEGRCCRLSSRLRLACLPLHQHPLKSLIESAGIHVFSFAKGSRGTRGTSQASGWLSLLTTLSCLCLVLEQLTVSIILALLLTSGPADLLI